MRTLWLLLEAFAAGQASVEAADEAPVNRLTNDRWFRLWRAALYQTQPTGLLTVDPAAILEYDEVYLTAGLKGQAGGWLLERKPRQWGLQRRGRGTWESDRLPVCGVLVRGGQVRLVVLRNLQQEHFRPLVRQLIQRGTRVYTDSYSIYDFLAKKGIAIRSSITAWASMLGTWTATASVRPTATPWRALGPGCGRWSALIVGSPRSTCRSTSPSSSSCSTAGTRTAGSAPWTCSRPPSR